MSDIHDIVYIGHSKRSNELFVLGVGVLINVIIFLQLMNYM